MDKTEQMMIFTWSLTYMTGDKKEEQKKKLNWVMLWCRGTLAWLHDIVVWGIFWAYAGDDWQQVLGDAVVRQVDT